eukprot:2093888-Heterocapsa_arctica.AAC.1
MMDDKMKGKAKLNNRSGMRTNPIDTQRKQLRETGASIWSMVETDLSLSITCAAVWLKQVKS